MNVTDQLRERFPDATNDQIDKASAIEKRLKAIDIEVKEYRRLGNIQKELYKHLIDRGFTNDEIWIYSPHIGADVGADEPDWV